MKKIIILLTLILLVGCSSDKPEETAIEYLDALRTNEYEKAKETMSNQNEFFSIEDFGNSVVEGFRRLDLPEYQDEEQEEILNKFEEYIDICVKKSMDFSYEITEVNKNGDYTEVVVNLEIYNGEEFKTIAINEGNFAEYLDSLTQELKAFNIKKSEQITLNLVKENDEYKIENGVEINNVLIEPFLKFISVYSL